MATPLKVLLPYYMASFTLLVAFGLCKLVHLFPGTGKLLQKLMHLLSSIEMQKDSYWHNLFGLQMFKSCQKIILRELQKEALIGHQTPNPLLFSVDGNTSHRLLHWARGSRPLVVNFGSCTCPVFMARLCEFGDIVDKFSDVADFLTIYIEEAHPTDEWHFKNNVLDIAQHRSLEERCKAAQALLSSGKLKTPLVVDEICNSATNAFAALPDRLYIIQNEKVQYGGGIGPTFYNLVEVAQWLEQCDLSDPNNNNPAPKVESIAR